MSRRKSMGKDFDHQRMDEDWYDTLTNPVTIGRFVTLLIDYEQHLRIHHEQNECEPNDQEQESATKFAHLVDDPVAWPQAQQYISPLRMKIVPEVVHCKLWSRIFAVVQHRMQPSILSKAPTTPDNGVHGSEEGSARSTSNRVNAMLPLFEHVKKQESGIALGSESHGEASLDYDKFGALVETEIRSSKSVDGETKGEN